MDRHSVIGLKFLALVPVALAALLPMRVMAGLPQQAATQPTGVIAGRVVDAATGESVAGAQVELRESGPPSARTAPSTTQTTTAEGAFEFARLQAGSFVLRARAEGYLLSGSGVQRPGDFQGGVALQSGERLMDFVLKLWRAGTISGTVRDESGEPVVQAMVQPLRLEYRAGERVWVVTRGQSGPGLVRTDDRGAYRLTDLQPADYIVMVPGSASGNASPARSGAVYETGFSGSSPSARGAQVVALESGEDRTGVDVLVRYGNGAGRFPVSGRLVAPAGAPLALTVRLIPAEGSDDVIANYEELTVGATSEGRFTFPGVPAGQYRLQTWQFQPVGADASQLRIIRTDGMSLNIPAQNRTGRALPPPPADPTWVTDFPVTVDKAIADLTVSLQPGARIIGRVIFDGDGPRPTGEDLLKIPVVPVPAFGRTLGVVPGTRIEEDGRFATVGLPPGPYVLRVDLQSSAIAGGPWYPMPVTSGGRALIGRPIELGTSDVDVTVTFTNRLARLNISVRDTSGRETGDARVILFARDPLMRGHGLTGVSDCVDQISVDRSGKSARPALPWCDYLAAAISNPPRLWMAPDYLESLVPFAAPANVEAGQTRTLDLVARP